MNTAKIIQAGHILLMVLIFSSCSGNNSMTQEAEFISSLSNIIETTKKIEGGMEFSLKNLQDLKWDKMYIFAPYTSSAEIENAIGAYNATVERLDIEARDDISLLIFMQENEITAAVPYPRQKADFSRIASVTQALTENTLFKLVESTDEQGWFYVELLQSSPNRDRTSHH